MVKMPFKRQEKPSTVDVNKLIDRGAPVKEDLKSEEAKKWTCINLRLPSTLLKEIDETVDEMVGITRTGWILQTLQKEINRLKRLENEESKE